MTSHSSSEVPRNRLPLDDAAFEGGSAMERETFERFRKLVYEKSGITLGPRKESLVAARISKRIRALHLPDHRAYLQYVMEDDSGEELVQLLDAIATNVTSFYREPVHFDFLSQAVTRWRSQGQRRFRFWSAACSTGEEPYTMAITLREALGDSDVDQKILATDISTKVLKRCLEGRYSQDNIKPVDTALRSRYFDTAKQDGKTYFTVRETLRRLVVFRRLNLSTPPFPMQGPMDAIFCRNVMIYFDNAVRLRLLNEFQRLLKPGGFLMVGHAESLTGMMTHLRSVQPSIYVKEK